MNLVGAPFTSQETGNWSKLYPPAAQHPPSTEQAILFGTPICLGLIKVRPHVVFGHQDREHH